MGGMHGIRQTSPKDSNVIAGGKATKERRPRDAKPNRHAAL